MAAVLFGEDAEVEPPSTTVPGEAWAARQYRGRGLRIGRNRTVHRAGFVVDNRDMEIPAPDCHAGYFAGGRPWWTVYTPTTDAVDCALCLNGRRQHPPAEQAELVGGQLALDLALVS